MIRIRLLTEAQVNARATTTNLGGDEVMQSQKSIRLARSSKWWWNESKR